MLHNDFLGSEIRKRELRIWTNKMFPIPTITPSLFTSKVISVKYVLQVEVDVPWKLESVIKMPIVIGTVPSRSGSVPHQQYRVPAISKDISNQKIYHAYLYLVGTSWSNDVEATSYQSHNC